MCQHFFILFLSFANFYSLIFFLMFYKYCFTFLIPYSMPMETGRSHLDIDAIEKTKEFMRLKHPRHVRAIDIAQYTGKSQARAVRLLDYLSSDCGENENTNTDFLIYCNDEERPTTYSIFLDRETGIYAY